MRLLDVGCGWGGMVRHAARELRRAGARRDAVAAAGHLGAGGDQARRASTTSPRCGTCDYRDVAETGFDAVSSIGLTEHIGVRNYPAYFSFLADKLRAGRPAAQPLHHPAGQPRRGSTGRVHRPLHLPRRRAHRVRPDHHRDAGRRPRGAARGEPARALRADLPGLGAQPRRRTGTSASPRSGRARRGCGGSTSPAAASASRSTTSSCTRCSRVKLARRRRRRLPAAPRLAELTRGAAGRAWEDRGGDLDEIPRLPQRLRLLRRPAQRRQVDADQRAGRHEGRDHLVASRRPPAPSCAASCTGPTPS